MAWALESLDRLRAELQKMPGIGTKSAERLAYYLLRAAESEALALSDAIRDVKSRIRQCSRCFNITEADPCVICASATRDTTLLCVVEQPKDLMSLEETGEFNGVYHVLQGRIAPLDGVDPDQLTIRALLDRIRNEGIQEVILATNPDLEGDGTALFIAERLKGLPVRVTRIAKGIPSGSNIEFVGKSILRDALSGRRVLDEDASAEGAPGGAWEPTGQEGTAGNTGKEGLENDPERRGADTLST